MTLALPGFLPLSGQEFPDAGSSSLQSAMKPDWHGYARGSVYGGGKTYDLSMLFAELSLRPSFRAGPAFLVSDFRLRAGSAFDKEFVKAEVKEFYGGFRTEKADVSAGNQIIAWGRCDGFNPTGNLTSRDYFFLSPEPDDQLLSNLAIRVKLRLTTQVDLDAVAMPTYKPSVYRFDLFNFGGEVAWGNPLWPSEKLKNGSLALRINADLPGAGFSFSWFNGYDPMYGFGLADISWKGTAGSAPQITYSCEPYRKHSAGADFSIPAGSWIFKGECALNLVQHAGSSAPVPQNNFQVVAGLEKDFLGFHTLLQYIGQVVPRFSELREPVPASLTDPMVLLRYAEEMIAYKTLLFNRKIFRQEEASDHALSVNVSRSFGYDAWKSDLSAYYNFITEEFFLRGSLGWSMTDALSLKAGGFLSGGPRESLFDYAGPVFNGGFLELKVTF